MEKINAASLLLYYEDGEEYEFNLSPIQLSAISHVLGIRVLDIEKNSNLTCADSNLTYTYFSDETVQQIINQLQLRR